MGFLKSSIKSVGTLLLADFLFYGVAQSATPIFYERIDYMKKIRSYTSIWSVEKVLYSINDFRLPFPITFTQMTCPVCGNKTRLKIREDTELKKFPLYCPKCRQENLIEIKQFKVTVITEPDAKTQSR